MSISIKKGFDREPADNEKYLKTKIKSYEGNINKNFQKDKIPKEASQSICLSVTLTDLVYRTRKNYYPEVLLEESKYIRKKYASKYIIDGVEICSDDSDKKDSNYSDEENFDEENSNDESNFKYVIFRTT